MDSTENSILERKQFFIDSIARFCDKCGTPYILDDINIVQNTGTTTIIHFSCHNCKAKNIATFISPLGVSQRVPVSTDLESEEIKKFITKKEITPEELLELHKSLKKSKKISV